MNTDNSDLPLFQRVFNELKNSAPPASILIAMVLSALTANFFNEIPAIQVACQTGSVPARNWGIAIGFSVAIFVIAEIRKWIIFLYPESFISKYVLFKW